MSNHSSENVSDSACNVFPSIIQDMLCIVEVEYKKNGTITNDVLLTLHSILGVIFERALDLIESDSVVLINSNSRFHNRFLFQVTGSSGTIYTIFHQTNYCSCSFYIHEVVLSKTHPTCKHIIAAYLAYIWKRYKEISFDSDKFSAVLTSFLLQQ